MDLIKFVLKIAIIGVVYIIIFIALKIMYKDVKNGGKTKVKKKPFGLEILNPGKNYNLKMGAVVPIQTGITIGRKEDNMLILNDEYVSSHHAKIFVKNTEYFVQDMKSTNGTLVNSKKVTDKVLIKKGDIIEIGTAQFKVIG